jgi:hypothetical protein
MITKEAETGYQSTSRYPDVIYLGYLPSICVTCKATATTFSFVCSSAVGNGDYIKLIIIIKNKII